MKNANVMNRIASERIGMLLAKAESRTLENTASSKKWAKRYVSLASKISSHYGVSIPKELKYKICRNCGNFLVPGVNCSVKLASSHGYVVYLCECGAERHIFYKRRKKVMTQDPQAR